MLHRLIAQTHTSKHIPLTQWLPWPVSPSELRCSLVPSLQAGTRCPLSLQCSPQRPPLLPHSPLVGPAVVQGGEDYIHIMGWTHIIQYTHKHYAIWHLSVNTSCNHGNHMIAQACTQYCRLVQSCNHLQTVGSHCLGKCTGDYKRGNVRGDHKAESRLPHWQTWEELSGQLVRSAWFQSELHHADTHECVCGITDVRTYLRWVLDDLPDQSGHVLFDVFITVCSASVWWVKEAYVHNTTQ